MLCASSEVNSFDVRFEGKMESLNQCASKSQSQKHLKMVNFCAIVGCSNRGDRDKGKSFYRLPAVIHNQGAATEELSQKRRDLWLSRISRSDISKSTLPCVRVCSDHFITGKKAALYDDKNPDWAPSINLGHTKVTVAAASAAARYERVKNRKRHQTEDTPTTSSVPDFCPMDRLSDSESGSPAQTDLTHEFISKMEEEINSLTQERLALEERVKACKLDEDYFSGSDDKVKFYTGLPRFVCLMIVFDFVSDGISVSVRSVLSKFQQVVLTLMKLRLNLPVQDLAYRFSVSTSTVSRVFLNVIDVMYVRLRKLVRWPDKEELVDTMPMCFRINFGTRVVAVIDCFEVFIDRPSNLQARAETWSNYKHHNTVKFLIGITPQGAISFISKAWGGRTSDKFITENCGFLDKILAGDLVLADRGFDLSDSMALLSAYIKVPAFLKGKSQLTMADVIETRKIANVRIHVERVIGLVRQKYSILNGPIPLDYMLTSDEHDMTVLDKVAAVCCSLTNISPSIVPFN